MTGSPKRALGLVRWSVPLLGALVLLASLGWFGWSRLGPHGARSSAAGLASLDRDAAVLGVTVNGQSRAYPLRSLLGVEVVNDELGDQPIVVTF